MESTPAARRTADDLARDPSGCRRCPRLVRYREGVPPRARYAGSPYWRRPVPGFGDLRGSLVIVGLAPAAHGGNRTGRVFTGDESGRFLIGALHDAGYASQSTSESRADGLRMLGCYVTAAVKCCPPGDRPTPGEFASCSGYLHAELDIMKGASILALGRAAFSACVGYSRSRGAETAGVEFSHGARYELGGRLLYASYHPSPRNTHTGRLTAEMLRRLLSRIKREARPRRRRP